MTMNFHCWDAAWVSWLNIGILLTTLSLALYNASKDNIATYFAYAYAVISICVLVRSKISFSPLTLTIHAAQIYGWVLYQYRISLIRRRDPGNFDNILGPVLLSIVLFIAISANFLIRGA